MQLGLVEVFIFGFGLAMSIGPIAIAVMNKCLTSGLKVGMLCAIGASLGDYTFSFIAYNFHKTAGNLLDLKVNSIRAVSSIILVIFGIYIASSAFKIKSVPSPQDNKNINFITIYLLTLSSPISIIAFLALFGHISIENYSIVNGLLFSLTIFSASLTAQFIMLIGAMLARIFLKSSKIDLKFFNFVTNVISGMIIISFGVYNIIK